MGPRAGLERCEKLFLHGYDPRTVHPVARCYYRLSCPGPVKWNDLINYFERKKEIVFLFFCVAGCQKGIGATGSAILASLFHHSAPSVAKVTRLRGNMPRNQRRGNLSTLLTLHRTDILPSIPNSADVFFLQPVLYLHAIENVSSEPSILYWVKYLPLPFCGWGALKKLRKSVPPSLRPHGTTRLAVGGFLRNLTCVFFENLKRNFKFH